MYIAAISLIAPIGNLIIVPSFLKVPSQVNLIVVGRKLWARDWCVLGLVPVNPSSLMLQLWFRKRCNGNYCSPLSKVYCQLHPVAQPKIKLFMLKSLKNHMFCSYEKFIKTDKSSWWNKAKVVAFPSYWKFIENETTNKDVLPWMAWWEIQVEGPFGNTCLHGVCHQPINLDHKDSSLSFQSMAYWIQTLDSRIQAFLIRNKQTNVHRQWMQM